MSYLEQEIREQPEVLARLLAAEKERVQELAQTIRRRQPIFAYIAARGTSDHAATYAQYLLAASARLPVALATPSLYTISHQPPRLAEALVIGISQSGHSPDIVQVVAEGRRQGAMTLAITNNLTSPLAAAADFVLSVHAGEERSIAATKTYTAQLAALALLGAALSDGPALWTELEKLPDQVEAALALAPQVAHSVERYRYMDHCVLIGRGYNYPTALEIALKLKELTYVIAESYSSADFLHGPIAIIESGFPVILVAPSGAVYSDVLTLGQNLRERGAELVVISDQEQALSLAQTPLRLPEGVPEWLSPLVAIVPGQLFAAELTRAKGYDLDTPRGLHKVTRTV